MPHTFVLAVSLHVESAVQFGCFFEFHIKLNFTYFACLFARMRWP